MEYKRILTMQDISCVGQCSMTVALPILSACGQEVCILPTAVLSSHTGGFRDPNVRILSEDIPAILECWKREGIDFDYIYTGYLGSIQEVAYARKIGAEMRASGGILIVDPAMADHGKLYKGFTEEYALAMKTLCSEADIVMPNLTEAAMMTGMPYLETYDEGYSSELVSRLEAPRVVLTGVGYDPETTGVVVAEAGVIRYHSHKRIGRNYHGTGDIFASAFIGALAAGQDIHRAAEIAGEFTCRCIEITYAAPAHWYGVKFEAALPELIRMLDK